jgi:RimJ/RimL family protein N-acetyltransferase
VRINTNRLQLRPLTIADLDALLIIHSSAEVQRFFGILDRAELADWLARVEEDWAQDGYGRAAILDGATGRLIGRAGLKRFPEYGETELGWVLEPGSWGHGFATEAAHAWVRWGFENLDVLYLTSMIAPENTSSIAVAQRLGMTVLRTDMLLGEAVTVYSISRDSWPSTSPNRNEDPSQPC